MWTYDGFDTIHYNTIFMQEYIDTTLSIDQTSSWGRKIKSESCLTREMLVSITCMVGTQICVMTRLLRTESNNVYNTV